MPHVGIRDLWSRRVRDAASTRPHRRPFTGWMPSPAAAIALLGLFVALGGTSQAQEAVSSAKRLITGKQIKNNAITSSKVKNGSLLVKDFKKGQLPKGAQGAKGDPGPAGPQGPQGDPGPAGKDVTRECRGNDPAD